MKKINIIALCLVTLTGCGKLDNQSKPERVAPAPTKPGKSDPAQTTPEQPRLQTETIPASTPAERQPAVIDSLPKEPVKAPILGRVWTSADGRTLEAELISRRVDTVTLRRNADKKEFTLPISNLSDADRVYLGTSSVPVTQVKSFDLSRLNTLKTAIPTLAAIAPLDSSDPIITDSYSKYKRSIQVLSQTGYARSLEMIRGQIESDLKRLAPISVTILKNPPILTTMGWTKGSGAWREVWASRSIMAWLNGPLNNYLTELEKLR